MEFKGKCNIDRIVVSDPSYGDNFWCRYERNGMHGKDWRVQGCVRSFEDVYTDSPVGGKELVVALTAPGVQVRLLDDGSFTHDPKFGVSEFLIAMDTACVGIGVDARADELKASRLKWQPDCALKTLTDGDFGRVYEGRGNAGVEFLVIVGYLCDDAGYSEKDIVDYLTKALGVVLDKEKSVEETIAEAKGHCGAQVCQRNEDPELGK